MSNIQKIFINTLMKVRVTLETLHSVLFKVSFTTSLNCMAEKTFSGASKLSCSKPWSLVFISFLYINSGTEYIADELTVILVEPS